MKKVMFLMFAVVLTACSAMAQQNPYQLKNLQAATNDVTTLTNTVNAWKSFGSGFKAGSIVAAPDSVWGIKNDGYVYRFNRSTRAWDQQTAMGVGVYQLAVQSAGAIYALIASPRCPGQYEVNSWTGSSWSPKAGCFVQLAAGSTSQGVLLAGIYDYFNGTSILNYSTDGANSWQGQPGNWTSVSLGLNGLGCAVDNSHNLQEITSGNSPQALPSIPSVNGNVIGCLWAIYPDVVMAWTSTGYVYSMPLENFGTWQVVKGISAQNITGVNRFALFAEDTGSNVYHWNVNAPSLSATYGGQWNVGLGCPVPSHPCTSSTTHTLSHNMNFKTGHGYLGGLKQATDLFTHDIEVANITYNPSCDPFFGQQADPECVAEIGTTAFCNESHADVQSGDTNYIVANSTDVMIFSYNISPGSIMDVHTGSGQGYWLGEVVNAVIESCYVSDPLPACPAESPANIFNRTYYWGGLAYDMGAEVREQRTMNDSRNGFDSPYVYDQFYLAQQLPDGTLVNTICFGDPHTPTDFLYGEVDTPHCK